MKTGINCFPCFIRQALNTFEMLQTDQEIRERVLRTILRLTSEMDLSDPPPAMGKLIYELIRRESNTHDPYQRAKREFNRMAMDLYPDLAEKVRTAKNPLETALKLAIAGNIIDFGIHTRLQSSQVHQSIESALAAQLDQRVLKYFCRSLEEADQILYLADNTGEIVFDRLLIECLPRKKITLVVRGAPVINDALLEDAELVGLTNLVRVIDNGDSTPGIILNQCSSAFVESFQQADMIIAKGQGNFETLSETRKKIFFLFKAKCPVVAEYLGCPIDTMLFLAQPENLCN